MCIARGAIAFEFGVDTSASRFCMLQFLSWSGQPELNEHEVTRTGTHFQDQNGCSLSDDKTLTISVKRSGGFGRRIVESSGKAPRSGEASNGQRMDARLGTPSDHHVGITKRNETSRISDGMRACCACGGGGMVWALGKSSEHHYCKRQNGRGEAYHETISHGDVTRTKIDKKLRDEQRGDFLVALEYKALRMSM